VHTGSECCINSNFLSGAADARFLEVENLLRQSHKKLKIGMVPWFSFTFIPKAQERKQKNGEKKLSTVHVEYVRK
jgi:hypothetical protein